MCWFGSMICAVGTSAALHRLFGMSSSQLSTTTELFGLRPLLAAWMVLVALASRLIQGLLSLTCGGRQPPKAAARPGRWIYNGAGIEPLAVLAPASWFHTRGRRDDPADKRWQGRLVPVRATCYCAMSEFAEPAFDIHGYCRHWS